MWKYEKFSKASFIFATFIVRNLWSSYYKYKATVKGLVDIDLGDNSVSVDMRLSSIVVKWNKLQNRACNMLQLVQEKKYICVLYILVYAYNISEDYTRN